MKNIACFVTLLYFTCILCSLLYTCILLYEIFLCYFQGELLWADKPVHKVIEFTLSLLTDDSDKDRSSSAYDELLANFSAAGKARIEVSCLIVCIHKTYACTYTYTWTLKVIQVTACVVHTPQLSSHIALP